MRSTFIIGMGFLASLSLSAQSDWQSLTTPARNWVQVAVANQETMYAASELWGSSFQETMLARSTDGGMTWDSVNTFYLSPMGLEFFDADNGHLLGGLPSCGLYAGMMNITGGGGELTQRDYFAEFQNIGTVNLQTTSTDFSTFYIAGKSSTVYHTVDTGVTLVPVLQQTSGDWMFQTELSDVRFVSEATGFVCGYRMVYDEVAGSFNYRGLLFATEDGGTSWVVDSFPDVQFLSLHLVTDNLMFAFSPTHVARTADGGNSWTMMTLPFEGVVFQAVDEAHFFAADTEGNVWESTNSAVTWSQSLAGQNIRDLQCGHGVCLAGGDNGSMFKTTFVSGTDGTLLFSFGLSPNPAATSMMFTAPDATSRSYQIADMAGRIVAAGTIASGESIDISRLPDAGYVFSVQGLGSHMFTVQH